MPLIRTRFGDDSLGGPFTGPHPVEGCVECPETRPHLSFRMDPAMIPELVEGAPSITAAAENAASFLIRGGA